ncbi:peptide ABC transporter substrate-binding protein [Pseudomonas sp. RW407]|uniref:FecR domain-containing protein n=1 Tax=Pseudomonas sp. RW407 TaxID=2202894 RepID=UPI000D6EBD9B|nr:FecR family protein [Pseudomonas sp. RW407]PWU26722.1 peptide ABC transporter substrate-binding protein [Pseudomonas sp. RW407]
MNASAELQPDARVVKQAIQWMLRLSGGADPLLQEACAHWRAQRAEHELAWQRVQSLNQELRSGLQSVPGSRVALETLEKGSQRLQRRQALKLLSLVALGGSALWLSRDLGPWQRWSADYASGVGERKRFVLADGSKLLLNTDTAVDVFFAPQQRLLVLQRGEILVSTAKDPARPLRVRNRDGLFEALGTCFVLRQDAHDSLLSVQHGAVAIAPRRLGQARTVAEAGQRYRVDADGATPLAATGMDSSAWAEGLIVSRDMRLADFLAEVARYRHGHLGCDPLVADLRLSGVFRLDDTDKLLDLLPRTLPVRVMRRSDWWVTVEART